jgi:hypothetical protein
MLSEQSVATVAFKSKKKSKVIPVTGLGGL